MSLMIWASRSDRIRSAISIAFSVSGSSGSASAAASVMFAMESQNTAVCEDFVSPNRLFPKSSRQHWRRDIFGRAHSLPIQSFEQRRKLRRGQTHHAILDLRPAKIVFFKPLCEQTHTRSVPEQELQSVGALGPENVNGAVERIGLHDLAHQRRQAIRALAEIDGPGCDHHAQRAARADHFAAFSAPMMAFTIPGSAPGQMKTLDPSTSNSIACGRATGGWLASREEPPLAAASTTTGTKPSASPPRSALRRASRRQVKSCCGVTPCCRATAETTAPASKDASTARDFSSSDQRRRPPPPVITSIRRAAAVFGSSVRSSLDTSRSPMRSADSLIPTQQ